MRVQQMLVPLSLALLGLSGCNVYDRWSGDEFSAGPVDASNFPPEYLGAGANRQRAGTGTFTTRKASPAVEYFLLPFSTKQRELKDPLAVRSGEKPVKDVPTPSAYVFDGCTAPEGYAFDPNRDEVHYDQQGVIFSALPSATYAPGAEPTSSYVPIISRVPVTSQGVTCQKLKSERTVVTSREVQVPLSEPVNGKQVGVPDNTFHAYAIIEPGAAVFHADLVNGKKDPVTGVGLQKWGWYNQYLLAYLDGGEVPTTEVTEDNVTVVRMVPQKLYYPRSQVTVAGKSTTVGLGQGYDVFAARRGEPGYSPVCQVFTYDAGAPLTPDQLPKTEAEVLALVTPERPLQAPIKSATDKSPAGDSYVYCLQLE